VTVVFINPPNPEWQLQDSEAPFNKLTPGDQAVIPDCKNEKVILSKSGFTLRNGTNQSLIFNVYYKTQTGGYFGGALSTDSAEFISPDFNEVIGGIELGLNALPSNPPFYFAQCKPEYPI